MVGLYKGEQSFIGGGEKVVESKGELQRKKKPKKKAQIIQRD